MTELGWTRSYNLFEYVAQTARENAFSAGLVWLLGSDSPLNLGTRRRLVGAISGLDTSGDGEIIAETEWVGAFTDDCNNDPGASKGEKTQPDGPKKKFRQKLDVWIAWNASGESYRLAIENKIKSQESNGQLQSYDELIAQELSPKPLVVAKKYWTLSGRAPQGGTGWQPLSYKAVYDHIVREIGDAYTDQSTRDYLSAMRALTELAETVISDEKVAAFVFHEVDSYGPVESRIVRAKLHLTLQQVWLDELAKKLAPASPWATDVSPSSNGNQATISIFAGLQDRDYVRYGMQVQSKSVKIFSSPYPYVKHPRQDQTQLVDLTIEELKTQFPDLNGPSRPKGRYFISWSDNSMLKGKTRNVTEWAHLLKPVLEKLSHLPFIPCEPIPHPDH
jgi:hypothetical protein